jgi:hypothetical protein
LHTSGADNPPHGIRMPPGQRRSGLDFRPFVQNRIQQRPVNFDMTVVVDVAQLAEFVHEEADAGARRADHLGECFLTDLRDHWLRVAVFAEIREEKKHPGQPLLAGIEELIDQVRLDADGMSCRPAFEGLKRL